MKVKLTAKDTGACVVVDVPASKPEVIISEQRAFILREISPDEYTYDEATVWFQPSILRHPNGERMTQV